MTSHVDINQKTLQLVTLDFETYYDTSYSLLSKDMNMMEYIRSPMFKAHGVGIKVGDGETRWYASNHVGPALRRIDWANSVMLCHNTMFDGLICSHHYGIVPAFYSDTLGIARATHPHSMSFRLDTLAKLHGLAGKVKKQALDDISGKRVLTKEESDALGEYCVDDVDLTYSLFWSMYNHIPDKELMLLDATLRMYCDPVLEGDVDLLDDVIMKEESGKVAARMLTSATEKQLSSSKQFAALLEAHGVSPPMKTSSTTGKLTYAFAKTDAGFINLQHHSDERIRNLVKARLKIKSTIGETRARRLKQACADGCRIPVPLNYCGAHTLRWTGGDKMNMQNLTRGSDLRRSLQAPEGCVLVVADSAQIEARVVAWLAGQLDLLEAFRQKRDVYSEFASKVYGRHIDRKKPLTDDEGNYLDADGNIVESKDDAHKPDFIEGFVGKTCILGLGFGMGWLKLQDTLRKGAGGPVVTLSDRESMKIIDIYRHSNDKIVRLWKIMDGIITAMAIGSKGSYKCIEYGPEYIRLPNGLFLHYPDLQGQVTQHGMDDSTIEVRDATYKTRKGRSKIYGGAITENVVQAIARCIVADQMLLIQEAGYRIVTMTHDEIVFMAKEEDAKKAFDLAIDIMSTPPDYAPDLPLAAEGGWARNYSK